MKISLLDIVKAQKAGKAIGSYSNCSANRHVLEAAIKQAMLDKTFVWIEATSNQVDQFGGYTGMTPDKFVSYVHGIAHDMGMPAERVVLGGDHIGPNAWKKENAAAAMAKACQLVRDYVAAGFAKIHLDASMHCADDKAADNGALDPQIVAERAADLCRVAEETWAKNDPKGEAPVYVIGTEVPPPGGATEQLSAVRVTRVEDVEETIEMTRKAFLSRGLEPAWERVIAVVVQPGVEFGDDSVVEYDPAKARELADYIQKHERLVYETHSTDYQTEHGLRSLVKDHFAVLKVGPWLTFAFREALFALESIEKEWLGNKSNVELSDLRNTLEETMLKHPAHWQKYYHGDPDRLKFCRIFSYSDRCRYYWPMPQLTHSVNRLLKNLETSPVPLTLISQYLPVQYDAIRTGAIDARPQTLIFHKIMEVTAKYARACGLAGEK
jgi:D-tagatose-1,6-bisphosphate aldolase subunit GatZ/KbaZ